jgi:uracil-DNA glycosylase family 4
LSNLKQDILNYLSSLQTYSGTIYFEDSFDFKIDPNRKSEIRTQQKIEETNMKKKSVDTTNKSNKENKKKIKSSSSNSVEKDWQTSDSLKTLDEKINNCLRCELGKTRTNFVFGTGNHNADLMIIGEAPGKDEDLNGEPFVDRSGKLLTKIIESIGLTREDVFIANIIKCRPPNNRKPAASEVETCEPYLHKQIELINPKYILSLGLTATDTLLKTKNVMKDVRGQILEYRGKKLMITYQPAALLRNPNLKRPVWEDMKKLKSLLDN